jgi:ribosome biogenesis protein BMS1
MYLQLDCAKIADLVLLCVDAKFGFEMETFEFLNILQTHGFPKVMGVFTHLDQFRTAKNLRKTKKLLKHRFWTEIYDGAKMFYFSGVVNGKYLKNEVKQLTLFIQRVKVCSLQTLVYHSLHAMLLTVVVLSIDWLFVGWLGGWAVGWCNDDDLKHW